MTREAWESILTPDRMRALVVDYLGAHPEDANLGAPIGLLVKEVLGLEDRPGGGYTEVKATVRAVVERTPGLQYVEVPE
ncbi:MAG: hypothetical protein R6X16_00590 [Anaerolineae bacterium]